MFVFLLSIKQFINFSLYIFRKRLKESKNHAGYKNMNIVRMLWQVLDYATPYLQTK